MSEHPPPDPRNVETPQEVEARVRAAKRRRVELTAESRDLVATVTGLLFADDPMGINFASNTDEYTAEAEVIVIGLPGAADVKEVVDTFIDTLRDFFKKPQIWGMLLFVFLYRSGEGFLLMEAPLFLQASIADGGAGLSLKEKGVIDGTVSTVFSLLGGLAGGAFIARYGLKRSLLFMALCMNVPHVCFVILSQAVTADARLSLTTVATLVTIEKFGYSFGFVANMLYMMQQIAPGKYPMTHYAFCTALMNLVLIPTQMASGPLAEALGYRGFFLFVMIASLPSVWAAWKAPFPRPPDDGEASDQEVKPAHVPRAEAAPPAA